MAYYRGKWETAPACTLKRSQPELPRDGSADCEAGQRASAPDRQVNPRHVLNQPARDLNGPHNNKVTGT